MNRSSPGGEGKTVPGRERHEQGDAEQRGAQRNLWLCQATRGEAKAADRGPVQLRQALQAALGAGGSEGERGPGAVASEEGVEGHPGER